MRCHIDVTVIVLDPTRLKRVLYSVPLSLQALDISRVTL